jgi:23S rRNA pseudouridine955/2504/2580 synthase/23S rRNA pseudouridine1911/1915/1917 synthase
MKSNAPYTIIYDDENIVAVNKISGISVGADRWEITKERLDNIIKNDLQLETLLRVHRIDNGTSGLVMFAKNAAIHKKLSKAFEERSVQKTYIAVVRGRVSWQESECDLSLVPDGNKSHLTIVDKYRGKKSFTKFKLINSAGNYSVLRAFPHTGRQHQIRVHLAKMGHSVVCDELYGTARPLYLSDFKRGWRGDSAEERPLLARLGLHSETLSIPYTDNDQILRLEAPPHKDMKATVTQIEKCAR